MRLSNETGTSGRVLWVFLYSPRTNITWEFKEKNILRPTLLKQMVIKIKRKIT